ncbi:MAG: hypothetical protein HFJ38_04415 [Bacilli bacterium]|nr:hypothetical protein [Bacilli bacterium]
MSDLISVRIITTKKGYEKIIGLLEYWGAKELIETTAFANINKQYGNIVYLGWNRISSSKKKIVQSMIAVLMDNFKISYRVAIISKNAEDIYINSQICRKDENIPNIFLTCRFDNKKIQAELEKYAKDKKEI